MILGLRLDGLGDGAVLAEQAGLDFVLLGDPTSGVEGPVGADPLSVAAFLMTTTQRIGLVAAIADDWAPFNVARALASFDLLSGGRCGWMPLTTGDAARSKEHLDVVLKLFDSWEDDALTYDKTTAVFADRTKVHRIRHASAFFTVDGPLNAPRPPQGWPVLFQPLDGADQFADVVLAGIDEINQMDRARVPTALRLAEVLFDLGADTAERGAALAERMSIAYLEGRCEGFVFAPANAGADIPLLVDQVIPNLRARGLARTSYGEGDFRTRLGLARPANQFDGVVGP